MTQESRPAGNGAARESAVGGADPSSLAPPATIWLSCTSCDPHRCRPGCGRWLPLITYVAYDVATLGLTPHDREGCRHCLEGVDS